MKRTYESCEYMQIVDTTPICAFVALLQVVLPLVYSEDRHVLFCVSCPRVYEGVWMLICSNARFEVLDIGRCGSVCLISCCEKRIRCSFVLLMCYWCWYILGVHICDILTSDVSM